MVFPQNVSLGSIPIWGLGDPGAFPSVHGLSSDEKTLIIEEIKRVDGDIDEFIRRLLAVSDEQGFERTFDQGIEIMFKLVQLVSLVFVSCFSNERRREEFINLTEELLVRTFRELKTELEDLRQNIGILDDVLKELSVVFDYELWLLSNIRKQGFVIFATKIMSRCFEELIGAQKHRLALLLIARIFHNIASGKAPLPNNKVMTMLLRKLKTHSDELDAYLDTLYTLLDDEAYEIILAKEHA